MSGPTVAWDVLAELLSSLLRLCNWTTRENRWMLRWQPMAQKRAETRGSQHGLALSVKLLFVSNGGSCSTGLKIAGNWLEAFGRTNLPDRHRSPLKITSMKSIFDPLHTAGALQLGWALRSTNAEALWGSLASLNSGAVMIQTAISKRWPEHSPVCCQVPCLANSTLYSFNSAQGVSQMSWRSDSKTRSHSADAVRVRTTAWKH